MTDSGISSSVGTNIAVTDLSRKRRIEISQYVGAASHMALKCQGTQLVHPSTRETPAGHGKEIAHSLAAVPWRYASPLRQGLIFQYAQVVRNETQTNPQMPGQIQNRVNLCLLKTPKGRERLEIFAT